MDKLLSRIEALTNKLEQVDSDKNRARFSDIRKEMERVRTEFGERNMSNTYRDEVIESVAAMIERRFDDNNTNAFVHAVRSMKGELKPYELSGRARQLESIDRNNRSDGYNGTCAYPDEN